MPKYKVLGGRWGEGYEVGQVIELDTDAAKVRLELGEIELSSSVILPPPSPIVSVDEPEVAPEAVPEIVLEASPEPEIESAVAPEVTPEPEEEMETVEGEVVPKKRGRPAKIAE